MWHDFNNLAFGLGAGYTIESRTKPKNKMTKGQEKDLETVIYFIPKEYKKIKITEQDISDFFEYSDNGKKTREGNYDKFRKVENGFDALVQGKIRRGLTMRMWEEGVKEGTVPYVSLLFDDGILPRSVVDFMKKEMFRGIDSEIIESCYQQYFKHYENLHSHSNQ